MSNHDEASPPAELQIKVRASEWARKKLEAEAAEREPEEAAIRQISVRLPAEDVAFLDALSKRFGVSRNQVIGIFLGSAAGDAYEQIPLKERRGIIDHVSEAVGRPVRVRWAREIDVSEERALGMPERMVEEIIQEQLRQP